MEPKFFFFFFFSSGLLFLIRSQHQKRKKEKANGFKVRAFNGRVPLKCAGGSSAAYRKTAVVFPYTFLIFFCHSLNDTMQFFSRYPRPTKKNKKQEDSKRREDARRKYVTRTDARPLPTELTSARPTSSATVNRNAVQTGVDACASCHS